MKIQSFKFPCNKDSASGDKKIFPGLNFENASRARWLVAVLRRDSIFGQKTLEIQFLAKKSVENLLGSADEGSGWYTQKLLSRDNLMERHEN